MKFRLFTGFAAALCVLLSSCYPYNENPKHKKANQAAQKTAAAQEQVKKQTGEAAKKTEETVKTTPETPPTDSTVKQTPPEQPAQTPPTNPPAQPKKEVYDFATKVPGKEGFVFSPYNNKVVDVRGLPSGTLVTDPTYPASEKKYFRVP